MKSSIWSRTLRKDEAEIGPSGNDNLFQLRNEIDDLDRQVAGLLARRLELAGNLSAEKHKLNGALQDRAREKIVLENVCRISSDPRIRQRLNTIYQVVIQESLHHQEDLLRQADAERRGTPFPTIAVLGTGLIGGALARRVKSVFPQTAITAVDLPSALPLLEASGLFAACSSSLPESVRHQSLIILAAPPETNLTLLQEISGCLQPGQTVLDLSSTKLPICHRSNELDLDGAQFIGGHPFFGNEKAGFSNSASVEVERKTFVLTPIDRTTATTLEKTRTWLADLGLKVAISTALRHDQTVARTSHFIQLLATTFGALLHDDLFARGLDPELQLSGGAFLSMSRLMSSPSLLWRQIWRQNAAELSIIIKQFIELLSCVEEEIANDKSPRLEELFNKANRVAARQPSS